MNKHPRHICLVTKDIIGPIRNGGIGTAFYHLAKLLAKKGHKITLLYVRDDFSEQQDIVSWIQWYKDQNITLVPLPFNQEMTDIVSDYVSTSYHCYRWLKTQTFDQIHFHEWQGIGYYSLMAKKQGLAFGNCHMVVQIHSPTLWHLLNNAEPIIRYHAAELDYLERTSVRLADHIISPSQYMIDWCKEMGWKFPTSEEVISNLIDTPKSRAITLDTITELVFFGRLEYRKGLPLFLSAIQKLSPEKRQHLSITFLGKVGSADETLHPHTLIKDTLEPLDLSYTIIDHMNSIEAINYLKGQGRLAVIASLVENSPYTVLEALTHQIPFIAGHTGGIAELIATKDHATHLFTLTPIGLANALEKAIDHPSIATRNMSGQTIEKIWIKTLAVNASQIQISNQTPLISVCISHYNRPALLKRTLEAFKAQTYKNFEVIIVDDGSTEKEAIAYLSSLEQDPPFKAFTLIRQDNAYLGAARNNAAKHAKGEYILFMDDDNVSRPQHIEILVKAAISSNADILTSAMSCFPKDTGLDVEKDYPLFMPLGGSLSNGLYDNCFGDAASLIKKDCFNAVGGFSEIYGVGFEDYEFFAKACLNGFQLMVVPESLYFYQTDPKSMLNTTPVMPNIYRALTPYLIHYPELASASMLAIGYHRELPKLYQHYDELASQYKHVVDLKLEFEALAKTHYDSLIQANIDLELQQIELDAIKQQCLFIYRENLSNQAALIGLLRFIMKVPPLRIMTLALARFIQKCYYLLAKRKTVTDEANA